MGQQPIHKDKVALPDASYFGQLLTYMYAQTGLDLWHDNQRNGKLYLPSHMSTALWTDS